MIEKIISGGQTGADQAALDAAIKLGIPHGEWIPEGRIREDSPLSAKYKLQGMDTNSTLRYHRRYGYGDNRGAVQKADRNA